LEAVTALLGGHLDAVSAVTEWKPFVDAGKLRLLVTYGTKRMPNYPDVPTLMDLGYKIARAGFNGIVGPKGMSSDRVEILAKAFKEGMEDPEFHQVMNQFDMIAEFKSPKEFRDYLKELDKETETLIQRAGLMKK